MHKSNSSAMTVCVIALVAAVVMFIMLSFSGWQMDKEIGQIQGRAQVAANAEDMAEYLDLLVANMEERDLTSGHAAWFFKSPSNDLGLDYQAVQASRERAHQLAGLDPTTPAYNSGLDDLRGTMRELNISAWGVYWRGHILTYLIIASLIVAIGSFFVGSGASRY